LKTARDLKPKDLDFNNKLGEAYFKNKQLALASAQFKQVLSLNPNHISANVNLAWCEHISGRDAESIRYYKTALNLNPDYYTALTGLAQVYILQKNYSAAKELVLRAKKLKLHPGIENLERALNKGV
jgi:Flp pilus assembly protein TadD